MAKIKVSIDRNRCIGAGNCVDIAPRIFSQDEDDGIVILLQELPPEEMSAAASEAAQQCPAMAIRVEEI